MRFTPVFCLITLMSAPVGATAPSADAVFASDVLAARASGYRLADVAIDWSYEGEEGRPLLTLVLAKGRQAEAFRLAFGNYGDKPASYARAASTAPRERRVYAGELQLFATLAAGGPFALGESCAGDTVLSAPEASVSLRANDYYVVTARVSGKLAQERLGEEMASALGAGMELASMRRDEDGRIEVTLVDDEQQGIVFLASVDALGTVTAIEVRAARQLHAWHALSDGRALLRALRDGGAVRAIRVGDEERIDLELGGRRRFIIHTDATFERDFGSDADGECGC